MVITFAMKLQSPEYDAAGSGYQIPLPVTADSYNGDSMAAILALFDGQNKVLDFRQLRETIMLVGVITTQAATEAGFDNAIQMRDELRRIRAATARYGKNTSATVKSWLTEGGGGGTWSSAALIAAGEDDSASRAASKIRLVWDQYWDANAGAFKKLFVYGTVSNVSFANRLGATTQTRIPFALTFLAGSIEVGD